MVIKARDQASKKFKKVGKAAGGMGSMLKKAALAAGAFMGARAIKNFVAGSLAAFGEQEMAVKHLKDALDNLGVGSAAAMDEMKKFASEIQKVTTVGDEATLEMMSMGASMGKLSGDSLKAATVAAIGLAKAYKMDTVAAMRLVARASAGDTASLARYGIKLDETMSAQEKFNEVLEIGASNFKLAEGETETYNGQMAQLSNTWGDFKETIGEAIKSHIPGLNQGFKIAGVVIENWGLVTKIAFTSAKLMLIDFWEDTKHTFGKTIPDLLRWFGRNWKDVFKDLFNSTKAIFINIGKNIANFFKALWSAIKGKGFNFEWTPIMDGFESSLKELPKIAARELTRTEMSLQKQLNGMKLDFGDKLNAEFAESDFDAVAIAKKAGEGIKVATKKVKEKIKKKTKIETKKQIADPGSASRPEAKEARFLTFSGKRFGGNKVEKNTKESANYLKQLVTLQKKIFEKTKKPTKTEGFDVVDLTSFA